MDKIFVIIRGPSAAGKSTLTNILARALSEVILSSSEQVVWIRGDFLSHIALSRKFSDWKDSFKLANMQMLIQNAFTFNAHCFIDDIFVSLSHLGVIRSQALRHGRHPLTFVLKAPEHVLIQRNRMRDPIDFVEDDILIHYARTVSSLPVQVGEYVIDTSMEGVGKTAEKMMRQMLEFYPALISHQPIRSLFILG